jgi:hypothetical protein
MPTTAPADLAYEDLTNHPELMKAFDSFLKAEFSDENLEFMRAVDDLKRDAADPSVSLTVIKDQAASIYAHYVPEKSEREVNLGDSERLEAQSNISKLQSLSRTETAESLSFARTAVQTLVARDSFGRFKKSELAATAVDKIKENAGIQTELDEKRQQAAQLQAKPSQLDRLNATFGRQTSAQALALEITQLEQKLEDSRTQDTLKDIDIPRANRPDVIDQASQAVQTKASEAMAKKQKAQSDLLEKQKKGVAEIEKQISEVASTIAKRQGSNSFLKQQQEDLPVKLAAAKAEVARTQILQSLDSHNAQITKLEGQIREVQRQIDSAGGIGSDYLNQQKRDLNSLLTNEKASVAQLTKRLDDIVPPIQQQQPAVAPGLDLDEGGVEMEVGEMLESEIVQGRGRAAATTPLPQAHPLQQPAGVPAPDRDQILQDQIAELGLNEEPHAELNRVLQAQHQRQVLEAVQGRARSGALAPPPPALPTPAPPPPAPPLQRRPTVRESLGGQLGAHKPGHQPGHGHGHH